MENKNKKKQEGVGYTLLIWFHFAKEIQSEAGISYQQSLGFQGVKFYNKKEALKFREQIWRSGFPVGDEIGEDSLRVIHTRLLNDKKVLEFQAKQAEEMEQQDVVDSLDQELKTENVVEEVIEVVEKNDGN